MAVYKRHWYHNIYFEFYLNIPLLSIQTRLFKEAVERMTYDICRLQIKLYKWSWEFQLYKRADGYYLNDLPPKPKKRLSQRLIGAVRRVRRARTLKPTPTKNIQGDK